jgi:hypothetical protein
MKNPTKKASSSVIASGQRWRRTETGMTWKVVSVSTTHIGLSGPGPCRSYQTVTIDELEAEWSKESNHE